MSKMGLVRGGDRSWEQRVWAVTGIAVVASLLAAAAEDPGIRAVGLALLVLMGLALAWLTSGYHVRERPREALSGTGYVAPKDGRIRALHFAVSLLFNAGVFVVVVALLFRFQVVNADAATLLTRPFPLLIGLYMLATAAAAVLQVGWTGGVRALWYTRAHGMIMLGANLLVLILCIGFALAYWNGDDAFDIGVMQVTALDLTVFTLAGLLGVGTQVLLATGLPTTFDLFGARAKKEAAPADDEVKRGTPPIVYAAILAVATTSVIGFLFAQFNLAEAIGGFRDERVVYLIALLPVAMGSFFLFSTLAIWRESKRGLYAKKLTTKLRNDILVYGISTILAFIFMALLFSVLSGRVDKVGPFDAGRDLIKDLTALIILSTTAPIGFYMHAQNQKVDDIENRLPDLLNDLAESRRAGLTLPAALRASSRDEYGAWSSHVRKMADQVSWGIAFNDALAQFGERVKTNLVRRSVRLVIEASRTGGSVAEILKAAAQDAYEIKSIESDRRTTMLTYLIVIYVVYFVFLVVLASLDVQFLPELLAATAAAEDSQLGSLGSTIDQDEIQFVYFNAVMVQSIGNGLVGGVLAEARVTAGFRHVALMTLIGWITFRFLLPALA